MKSFALLLVCFQACLVQNVYSQCIGAGYGPGLIGPGPYNGLYGPEILAPGIASPLIGAYGAELIAPGIAAAYGGAGIGDVAVAGEMPVAGTTLVAGQVPILGAVRFAGDLPAAGTVTITGRCGCGCNRGPYYYTISAQCIGAGYGLGGAWPAASLAAPCDTIAPIGLYESAWNGPFCNGLGPAALAASNGAGLAVTSASPIAPTGVSMTSENCYEGPLSVIGAIPFLGAVSVEGALPTIGEGAVTYTCGNGNVAILNEDIAPLAGPMGFGAYGYDGLAGPIGFGAYGYDGLAGPYRCGAYGYDGLARPYGCAGNYGYDGLGYGYGTNGCGCGGALY